MLILDICNNNIHYQILKHCQLLPPAPRGGTPSLCYFNYQVIIITSFHLLTTQNNYSEALRFSWAVRVPYELFQIFIFIIWIDNACYVDQLLLRRYIYISQRLDGLLGFHVRYSRPSFLLCGWKLFVMLFNFPQGSIFISLIAQTGCYGSTSDIQIFKINCSLYIAQN